VTSGGAVRRTGAALVIAANIGAGGIDLLAVVDAVFGAVFGAVLVVRGRRHGTG